MRQDGDRYQHEQPAQDRPGPDALELGRPEQRQFSVRLGGVAIGIGRAGVLRVRLARVALAGRRDVVDMLEGAPQPLRPGSAS